LSQKNPKKLALPLFIIIFFEGVQKREHREKKRNWRKGGQNKEEFTIMPISRDITKNQASSQSSGY